MIKYQCHLQLSLPILCLKIALTDLCIIASIMPAIVKMPPTIAQM